MNSLSKRDRLMLIGLPAAIILLIYGFFFVKPINDDVKELRRQANALETQMPSQAKQTRVFREYNELQTEVRRMRKARSSASGATLSVVPSSEATMQADVLFESLLKTHQLVLMSETLAESSNVRAFRRVIERSPGSTLWNVELLGYYSSVAGLMVALGETELPLTAVALEMDASMQQQSDVRRWNLWIYR